MYGGDGSIEDFGSMKEKWNMEGYRNMIGRMDGGRDVRKKGWKEGRM